MHLRRAIHNRRHYGTGKSANTSDLGKNLQRIWNITGSFFGKEYGNLKLTVDQEEIVEARNNLDAEKRKVLMSVVRALKGL